MTTRATATLQALADAWENLYPSAVFAGIVGDAAHAARGGYHISIADNPAGNYSITRPDDKAPPGTWPRDCASAIDMNLALADMKTCHARLITAWKNRSTDPRAKYINAHNGWNGDGSPGRYDWYSGSVGTASDDHKWHIHLELRRRYVNRPDAADAVLSILSGETATQYQGEDMTFEADAVPVGYPKTDSANPTWTGPNALGSARDRAHEAVDLLKLLRGQVNTLTAQVSALTGKDFTDEPAIVQGVLAGLAGQTPEQTAAALRAVLGDQAAEVGRLLTVGSAGA